ncbi:MAG: hypothetical protein RBT05_00600 [Bacteroidales bacterium]|jgi:hypothetical protein|nr:hypothetical protein [Actinomycetota bacterium]MDX9797338.1 hypothetical protein [Bacteroidales bacterium]
MDKSEIDFLENELARINQAISNVAYGGNKDIVEAQIKLWELRDFIKNHLRVAKR